MNKYEKEAKPCPFCGEKIVDLQVYSFNWFFKGVIKCLKCKGQAEGDEVRSISEAKKRAVMAWNRRAE